MRVRPPRFTAFLSIAPKISISANISRVSILWFYGSYIATNLLFSAALLLDLAALAAMAQTKVKRL